MVLINNYYFLHLIIDVNLKSFACCNHAFENLIHSYVSLLNNSGKIFTGKKGMNWSIYENEIQEWK